MTGRGWELLALAAAAGLVVYVWRAIFRPWSPCGWCRGRGRVGGQRWRHCTWCDGAGRRMTWGGQLVRRLRGGRGR